MEANYSKVFTVTHIVWHCSCKLPIIVLCIYILNLCDWQIEVKSVSLALHFPLSSLLFRSGRPERHTAALWPPGSVCGTPTHMSPQPAFLPTGMWLASASHRKAWFCSTLDSLVPHCHTGFLSLKILSKISSF